MSTVSDSWHPLASTSTSAAVASPSTPSKRASRSSRVSNDTDYAAFTRTVTDPASGFDNATEFRIGDAVVVGADAKLKQKFLGAPLYQLEQKKKGKGKKKQEQQQQPYEGWRHEDGLEGGDKVAVITRLFEDVRGRKMALVRWFARPGAVWGPDGPEGDDEVEEVLPYELYYTADSTHLAESRALRSRAAANPFSSPSASPFKSSLARSPSKAYAARASNPLSAPSHLLSAAASFRTPQHSDPIPLSTITSHAEIFSPAALSASGIEQLSAAQQRPLKTFVCRRVYDVKPVHGAGFWSDLEWEELRQRGVEGYEEAMAEGGAAKAEAMDGWDVEARMEESEEEEESEEQIRKRQATLEKRKKTIEAKRREREAKGKMPAQEEESSEDEGDEEDTFDPRSHASDSDSDGGEHGDATGPESDGEGGGSDDGASDSDGPSRTPSRKRGRRSSQIATPSSARRRATSTFSPAKKRRAPTASSARAAKRKRVSPKKASSSAGAAGGAHNPLPPLLSASHLASLSPFERAKALLHVSATPEALPCREEQRERIRTFLEDAILGRTGGCLYVHGVPGTGKTATVHSVVRELQADEDMDAFTFVEINGMKISEPMAAFSHLWSAIAPPAVLSASPRKPAPRAALSLLESHFSTPDPARKTVVVLVDELDQMLTKRQDVLYSFFNWPHVPHSRLVVVAVANTMDLPEREMSGKLRSRLGTNRIPFSPYTWTELKRILEARLSLVDPSSTKIPLFDDVALQKIAKSVAGISGDARKALDVARRTLDRVALRLAKDGKEVDEKARCTIQDVTQAYNDMTRQGPAVFVRRCSTMGKVLLLAVAQCVRRAGVPEVEVDTVLTWHLDFLRQTSLLSSSVGGSPKKDELLTLLSELHALRLVAAESQRLDVFQRVRPAVDEGDLFAALREDEVLGPHVPRVL